MLIINGASRRTRTYNQENKSFDVSKGRRLAFTLGTGNREAAAKGAAACYGELLAHGIEATLTKYRVQNPAEEVAIDPPPCGILQGFKARATSQYV